jgi:transposase
MNKARLIITAINVEKISQAEAARRYGVTPGWVSKLVQRHRIEGEGAFKAKQRRPHNSPTATPKSTVELITQLRDSLTQAGRQAGRQATMPELTPSPGTWTPTTTSRSIPQPFGDI